jgi:hypothetical protein
MFSKRNKFFLLVFFVFFSLHCSFSQVFKGEIIVGGNVTQVDGDEVYGYRKVGVNAGLGVMFPFNFKKGSNEKRWAVSMEMLFNQKGSYLKNYTGINFCDTCPPEIQCNPMIKYKVRMNYVSIPLLLHYNDKDAWIFAIGLSYNRLAKIKEIENGIDNKDIYSISTIINPSKKNIEKMLKGRDALFAKDELSVLVDVRFRIWQQLKMEFRFEYSIFPVGLRRFHLADGVEVDPYIRKQYNNVLSLRLIYMLNEPKVIIEKKPKVKPENKIYYY